MEIQPGQPAGATVSGEITMVPANGVVMDPNGGTLVVVGPGTVASEGGVLTCGAATIPANGDSGATCVVIGGVQTGGAAGGATVPEAGQTTDVIINGQVQTCTVSGAGGSAGASGAAGTSSVQVPATSSPEAGTSAGGQAGQ
jgi:hypothetical protein